jgi:Protein of unknown function (DUF2934)
VIRQERRTLVRASPASISRKHVIADPRPEPEIIRDNEDRWSMIAENAYYRAQQRGFLPGCELEDWLAAEQEIDKRARWVAAE